MKSEEVIYLGEERENERIDNAEVETSSQRFMMKGEAPVLMGKACELLIRELTTRSWRHTERSRRKTLQRADVQAAIGEDEVFDYLIDIIPRPSHGPQGLIPKSGAISDSSADETLQTSIPILGSMNTSVPTEQVRSTETGMSLSDARFRLAHLQRMHEIMMMQQIRAHANGSGLHHNHNMNVPIPVQIPVNINPAFYVPPQIENQAPWTTARALRTLQDAAHLDQQNNENMEEKSRVQS